MKILIFLLFVLIVGSLFSALVTFMKDHGQDSERTVKALTWRIGLSVFLFILLMVGFFSGFITPHSM